MLHFFILKVRFCIVICFFSIFVFAQDRCKEIDSLLDFSTLEYENYDTQKSIDLAKQALKKAEELKISQAIAEANYNIARGLGDIGKQKESFSYIEKAEKEDFARKNNLFRAKLREIAATNYMTLGMYPQAIKEFHKALQLTNKTGNDSFSKMIRGRTYGNLYVAYHDIGNLDSAYYYLDKEIQSLKNSEEAEVYSYLSLSYLDYGLMYLEEKKNLDSAQHYFQKSLYLLDKHEDPFKQDVFRALGDLYYVKKEYDKSLNYYLESQQILNEIDSFDPSYTYILKRISEIYRYHNNFELEQLYLDKYIALKDSLSESKIDAVGSIVNDLLKKQEKAEGRARNRIYLIICSVFLISAIAILVTIHFYGKKQRQEKEARLNKEKLLIKKENENQILKQQLNTAFDEVVQLAKANDSSFLSRFMEVYPEFSGRLKETYPALQSSELTFCAMLFLNFSSKDIAEFTFVTPKAVQNRKNRLRKKLNIPSEEDLNIWMQKIPG